MQSSDLSDPHKAQSQTGFLFSYGDTAPLYGSTKQTMATTSSNHEGILTIHKASQVKNEFG